MVLIGFMIADSHQTTADDKEATAHVLTFCCPSDALSRRSESLSAAQRGRGWGPLRSNGRVRWCSLQSRFFGRKHRGPPHPPRATRGSPPSPPVMTRAERAQARFRGNNSLQQLIQLVVSGLAVGS